MGKLSHDLLDLGFFCALGTSEHRCRCGEGRYVKRGTPLTYDQNNGTLVIYDEEGRPWIAGPRIEPERGASIASLINQYHIRLGAYVPHSNDGGHFVRTVLPTL